MTSLYRIRGIKNYKGDKDGLKYLLNRQGSGNAAMEHAVRAAGNAQAVGRSTYEAVPTRVTAGYDNEHRAGAVIREVTAHGNDAKDAILKRVIEAMEVRNP